MTILQRSIINGVFYLAEIGLSHYVLLPIVNGPLLAYFLHYLLKITTIGEYGHAGNFKRKYDQIFPVGFFYWVVKTEGIPRDFLTEGSFFFILLAYCLW